VIELLRQSSLLLLFVVIALGIAVGRFRLFNIQLGSAAVLFVGLVIGAVDADLDLPPFISQLGLVIFVYAIGLSNGASFFRSIQQQGSQQINFILFFLTLPVVLVIGLAFLFDLDAAAAGGVFSGVGTNTAALAGLLDMISAQIPADRATDAVAATAVAFAVGYPLGVMGRIVVITWLQHLWRIDFAAEAQAVRDTYPIAQEIIDQAVEITQPQMTGVLLRELQRLNDWDVVFGRLWREGHVSLVNGDTQFQIGDVIFLAGESEAVHEVMAALGRLADNTIFADYSVYTKRWFFVSNPAVVGQPVITLDLKESYGALISRVRRGDTDLLATKNSILELGDQVRVLAPRTTAPDLVTLFGDSYDAVSRVNLFPFGLGVTVGILLGLVSITLPGGVGFQVGFAGGTLIVALILGALRRTGAIVWTLPYSTNQTLQQFGLVLLLAGVGVSSGNSLENVALGQTVLLLVLTAMLVVLGTTAIAFVVGYKLLGLPFGLIAGMLAAPQPAVFSYVSERAESHLPNIGFTMAIPIGLILHVVYAQLLFSLLNRL